MYTLYIYNKKNTILHIIDLLCNDVIDNITLMTSQFYVRIFMVTSAERHKGKQKLKKTFNRKVAIWETCFAIYMFGVFFSGVCVCFFFHSTTASNLHRLCFVDI